MVFYDIFQKKKRKEAKELPIIIIDSREKNSLVASELVALGFKIEFRHLPVADYLINGIAIERKTINDFKSSIISRRLISQLQELKQYPAHLLILEGIENHDIYSGIIHENAFRGFLLSVALEHKVPVIFTLNEDDTATYLAVLAKKQANAKTEQSVRASKILLSKKQQLQFILEGFPNIGPITAKKLLKHFSSLSALFNASQEDLQSLIGKKANAFKLLHENY